MDVFFVWFVIFKVLVDDLDNFCIKDIKVKCGIEYVEVIYEFENIFIEGYFCEMFSGVFFKGV